MLIGALAAALLALPWTAAAQVPRRAKSNPAEASAAVAAQLLQRAYEQTQQAKTAADYGVIIRLCQQAGRARLSPSRVKYAAKLMSWAHNRRGEALADEATALSAAGKKTEARAIDARALDDFEAAIRLDPKRWQAIHNRGVSQALTGKFDQAIDDFTRTIELKPDYSNAWFNRGEIFFELKRYKEALTDYSRAVTLKPDDAGAFKSRGDAYYRLGQFRQALRDYDRVVQLRPRNATAYVDRAEAYVDLGDWHSAARDFRAAVKIDNKNARAYQAAAWLMATCPDARYRDGELAVRAAQRAVALKGEDDYLFLDTLAAAHAAAGQFAQAKASVIRALAVAPEGAAVHLKNKLSLYEQNKSYQEPPRTAAAKKGQPKR